MYCQLQNFNYWFGYWDTRQMGKHPKKTFFPHSLSQLHFKHLPLLVSCFCHYITFSSFGKAIGGAGEWSSCTAPCSFCLCFLLLSVWVLHRPKKAASPSVSSLVTSDMFSFVFPQQWFLLSTVATDLFSQRYQYALLFGSISVIQCVCIILCRVGGKRLCPAQSSP